MEDREINIRVATEVMNSPRPTKPLSDYSSISTDKTRCWMWQYGVVRSGSWEVLPFTESVEMAYRVEERIKELGLEGLYVRSLKELLGTKTFTTMFDFIHASPRERCLAALTAINKSAAAPSIGEITGD